MPTPGERDALDDGRPPVEGDPIPVVIDTNVFVGAGFKPRSGAGRVVQALREGRLRMVWSDATRHEIETVVRKIPPLDWSEIRDLFRESDRLDGAIESTELEWVPDPSDRKFAALARAAGAILVTNDDHLLARRDEASFPVLRSGECADELGP
jgi:predicted nucleic acid-binding protein